MVTNYTIFDEMPTRKKSPITRFRSENPHVDFRQGFVADHSEQNLLHSLGDGQNGPFPFTKTLQNYF
jgi:hypothetical protein